MVKKTLIYWRDIPAQIIVQRGRRREKVPLSARFVAAIDRAAMRAGKGSSDKYLEEWRRETLTVDADVDIRELAEAEAGRFEAQYDDEQLLEMIRNHGWAGE